MSWTRPADLHAQLERVWARGEILSSLVAGTALFPRRLSLKGPSASEMADRFDEVRAWATELAALAHYRLERRAIRHRVLGANSLPKEVWVSSLEDAIAILGKEDAVKRFRRLIDMTLARVPALLEWLKQRPLRALEFAAEWDRLLAVITWLSANPRPGIYLRQIDIPGIDSKFIETHRGVLTELLDHSLPKTACDPSAIGINAFAQRYGFRDKPLRIRFRILDPDLAASFVGRDVTLDAESFARLRPTVSRVFITENEINFLAFPEHRGGLVIFGAGYGFTMLREARWLGRCRLSYWGDIDTHGFAILDQLRQDLSHVESFLMDRATLLAHESQWGFEDHPTVRELPRLGPEERLLFDDLRDNRIRPNLRLEQERIAFGWVQEALSRFG